VPFLDRCLGILYILIALAPTGAIAMFFPTHIKGSIPIAVLSLPDEALGRMVPAFTVHVSNLLSARNDRTLLPTLPLV
jgi:hypothetical protein